MDVRMIKLKKLEDLVHVLNTAQIPVVHHMSLDSRQIYFIPFILGADSSIIYFYENEKMLSGKFLLFNNFTGEITVSDKWTSDTRYTVIPIIEVDWQNVFPEKQILHELRAQTPKVKVEKERKGQAHRLIAEQPQQ
ncbi:hypothetical protein [Thermofilum pendens]|uniref:Uncharacterized protein n=1 Tax=Thermofilum pendens (strain DSM 2475 / Hrk 5) TaxID=368408 RepID=A1RWS5_THEPD|nr:hypothetical protein [Thermofilum pendens]ABL77655.1 hypothetical protein Tpen_0245 [Thermofilum pendens Hrk 5]